MERGVLIVRRSPDNAQRNEDIGLFAKPSSFIIQPKEKPMSEQPPLSENQQRFMEELYRQAEGNTSAKVETAAVGQAMGLEKADAGRLSEELIGRGLVEIRTLSGGISLTPEGAELVKADDDKQAAAGLGKGPLLEEAGRIILEALLAKVKTDLAGGADFDLLAAAVADIRTIEAQLGSPRPRTAVIRSALEALAADVEQAGIKDRPAEIKALAGS